MGVAAASADCAVSVGSVVDVMMFSFGGDYRVTTSITQVPLECKPNFIESNPQGHLPIMML